MTIPARAFFRCVPGVALALILPLVATVGGSTSASAADFDVKAHYIKSEHMVPMRDGVRLHTTVYAPRRAEAKLPFLLQRTPYGCAPYGPEAYRTTLGPSRYTSRFEEEGFIFVFQDVRGKFKSEGDFVVMRPHRPNKAQGESDESSDTYDTIAWLLEKIPGHNGRVGMIGTSYPGFQVIHGLIDPHPALKAASPAAPPLDMFLGDDFHHNGAFRIAYSFLWLAGNASTRTGPTEKGRRIFEETTPDGYRFFLDLLPLSNADKLYFHGQVPTWNQYMAHPDYDDYWKAQNVLPYMKGIKVPTLHVAGWFDGEDFYGPMTIYKRIEESTPDNKSTLVVGPYKHGGWNDADGGTLGKMKFAGKPAAWFRDEVLFPFFRTYLKEDGEFRRPEALVYETGANRWRSFDQWPPAPQSIDRHLYLHPGGRLAFEPPTAQATEGLDSFVSDPAKPVPATAEIRFGNGHTWMVEDQRFAANRPDVLVYQTEPLAEDLVVAGAPIARVFLSSSGTDADLIVKLIDVYPDDAPDHNGGAQMLIAGEVFRVKYRNSFEKPEPLVPGKPAKVEIDLRDRFHRFLKRHRLMVQIQASWFPVIDVNPGEFGNIYAFTKDRYRKTTLSVHREGANATHLTLPVLKRPLGDTEEIKSLGGSKVAKPEEVKLK